MLPKAVPTSDACLIRLCSAWRTSSHPLPAGGVAWGSYYDGRHSKSNFGQLRVSTSRAYDDSTQLFAAGFLEGYLTAERIYDNWVNMKDYFLHVMGAEVEEPMQWWVLPAAGDDGYRPLVMLLGSGW